MKVETIIKRIKVRQKNIAAERDKLRDLISEAESIVENCDSALLDLENAADTLSELL